MATEAGEFWKSFFPEKNNEKDNSQVLVFSKLSLICIQFVAELQPLPQSTTASTIICFVSSSTLSFLIVLGIIVLFIIMFYHLHVNFVKLNSSLDRIENSVDRLAANKNKRLQK